MYEIIDARSKGWQLRETEGGSRKGLLIRRERFEISVSHSLCQNAIKKHPSPHPPFEGDSHAFIFRGVRVLLFKKKKNSVEASVATLARWLGGVFF